MVSLDCGANCAVVAFRRLTACLALLLASFAWEASAAEPAGCPTSGGSADTPKPTIGEAYTECMRCVSGHVDHLNSLITWGGPYHSSPRCTDLGPTGGSYGAFQGKFSRASDGATSNWGTYPYPVGDACVSPEAWDPSLMRCVHWESECLARPEVVEQWQVDGQPGQDLVCHEGCTYGSYFDPSTGQSYYSTVDSTDGQWFGQCTVGPSTPAPSTCTGGTCFPDADGDGSPDDVDAFPNDPGEDKDSDGDGLGDNGDVLPNDPNNGSDGSGPTPPGTGPGDDTDNYASGGGVCGATPPACSGDGILCNLLMQQYKARCALERIEGHASGIEDGIQDLLAQGSDPNGSGDDDTGTNGILSNLLGKVEDMSDWMMGDGTDPPGLNGPTMPEKAVGADADEFESYLDGSASCPEPVSVSIEFMGTVAPISFEYTPVCDFLELVRPLILALGSLLSAYIVVGLRR